MAQKSKTQRAKASARRAERKAQQEAGLDEGAQSIQAAAPEKKSIVDRIKGFFSRDKGDSDKKEKTVKKDGFFRNVRKEMARVTWPSRQDVIQWTGVVVGALIFFGVYVFVLDNFVVTPVLLLISSLGA